MCVVFTWHNKFATADRVTQVNIGVGKKLAGAIETGEQVTEATKETIGKQFYKRGPPQANCGIGAGSVKDAADKVNKKAGRGLASTIEKGEDVTEKTKETLGKPERSPSCVMPSLTLGMVQVQHLHRPNRPPRRLHKRRRRQRISRSKKQPK